MKIEIRIELDQDDIPDWVKALLQDRSGEPVTAPAQAQKVSPSNAAPEVTPNPPPALTDAAEPVLAPPEPSATIPAKRGRGRPRKEAVAAAVVAKVDRLATKEPEPPPAESKPPEPEPKVTVLGLDLPASQVTRKPVIPETREEQTEPDAVPVPVDPLVHLSMGQRMLIDAGLMKAPTTANGDRVANLTAQVAFEYDRVTSIYGAPAARQISGKALPEGVKFKGLESLPEEFMPQVLSALRART